jgi:hypothetical protein
MPPIHGAAPRAEIHAVPNEAGRYPVMIEVAPLPPEE